MRSEIPVWLAAFIGRERERAKVAELVVDGRAVTLTGAGGCGKTRLASEVVNDVEHRFGDGVSWVDLQGVSDPAMVAAAVGAVMDVQERPEEGLVDTLARHLRSRHLLLVLDSCEHVVASCAELVLDLLSLCPRLHVLATSRVPLVIDGEASFDVAPLPVPDPEATSVSAVTASDAARLFEVRARQVATDFRIDGENASAVGEICRRLDGIPLAIEMAAVRVRVLAPEQIAAGLSDRFRLLSGGIRGAPARQQTLEASLDWSHDLLDDDQRVALARLSVFNGSFELDAAEAVVGGDGVEVADVLDLLTGLVEQSWIQVVRYQDRARYRLLETIRAYARNRLSDVGDVERVRQRHLAFHVGLAARAREGLHGPRPERWISKLTADLDDLRAAMDWAAQTGDLEGLVGLHEPVARFWLERGLSREAHRRLHDAASTSDAPPEERVRGLNTAASLALATYEPAAIHRSAVEAVAAARQLDRAEPLALALAHRALSGILSGRSTTEQLTADVEEAVEHADRSGEPSTRAYVLQFAGAALLHGRSIEAGYRLFRESIEVCTSAELSFHLSAAHGGAQAWLPWSGRLDETRRHARLVVELSRRQGRPGWESVGYTGLAACAVLQGDHGVAKRRLSEARALLGERGLQATHYAMWQRHWQALAACAVGDVDTARATADEIVRVAQSGGSRMDEAMGEWLLGLAAQGSGRYEDARAHFETSRALSTDPRLPHTLGRSILGLAALDGNDGDLDEAWELAHESLEVLDEYGDRVGAALALEVVADLAVALGEPERGLRLLAASDRFHADLGLVRFPQDADRVARAADTARAAMGPTDGAASWEEGGAMSLADAIAYARRGRGERRRPRFGWAALTPAERDVVRLVAEGHTNAEIGEQLFISVNTVKKHLSHVYGKVDVAGRAGLAAEAASRGI